MSPPRVQQPSRPEETGRWQLQDAQARFSEVVRRAVESGPQHLIVNGEEQAVVLSTEEYVRLRGQPTGRALVDLMADSPLDDVVFEHPKVRGPVRAVTL